MAPVSYLKFTSGPYPLSISALGLYRRLVEVRPAAAEGKKDVIFKRLFPEANRKQTVTEMTCQLYGSNLEASERSALLQRIVYHVSKSQDLGAFCVISYSIVNQV